MKVDEMLQLRKLAEQEINRILSSLSKETNHCQLGVDVQYDECLHTIGERPRPRVPRIVIRCLV